MANAFINKDMLLELWAELKQREATLEGHKKELIEREKTVSARERAMKEKEKEMERNKEESKTTASSDRSTSSHPVVAYYYTQRQQQMIDQQQYNAGFDFGLQAAIDDALSPTEEEYSAEYQAGYDAGLDRIEPVVRTYQMRGEAEREDSEAELRWTSDEEEDEDVDERYQTNVVDEDNSSDGSFENIDDFVEKRETEEGDEEKEFSRVETPLAVSYEKEKTIQSGASTMNAADRKIDDQYEAEERVIAALRSLSAHSDIFRKDAVLRGCYEWFKTPSKQHFASEPYVMELVLKALGDCLDNANLQTTGLGIIYHLLPCICMGDYAKEQVIDAILTGMQIYPAEAQLVLNGLLILYKLDVPKDLLPMYRRVARVLIRILRNDKCTKTNGINAVNLLKRFTSIVDRYLEVEIRESIEKWMEKNDN